MENKAFTRYKCWDEARIIQIINKEAVSVDRNNFLATHAPLNKIHYERLLQEIADKSEQGLLDELRRCNLENRHVFAVVQGIPGTGKSHLIRWLKETYEADIKERQDNDVVVLIERAQCNLRGTLMQIIASDAFKYTSMQDYLEKLSKATDKLSSDTLEENILDHIRNATGEVELPAEYIPKSYIRKRVKPFLLDIHVRQELKKPGGPIGRIRRYLAAGENAGIGNNEIPGFIASDFEFDLKTLNAIKGGGYEEPRDLAEKLHDPEEIETRQELADYFNRLLNYAIERTTAISTDDLKQIFNELRRQLRKNNRQLALFIEDITAFTGIDKGLIDVLATQHTGESNREFCRLTSVIGITDNYFDQHFPDNMKERVTHRLTLNTSGKGILESDLLQSSMATADISARYLNAIRLSQEKLDDWVSHGGASLERIPNACDYCEFKATCHSAFGSVNINPNGGTPKAIGLYPFNETSIWVMYQQMSTTNTPRTPRSLLSSVLSYVLESHGKKIEVSAFPPPAREMGSDFKPPTIGSIAHQRMIRDQAGNDAPRVESLILFWGTRTIDATIRGQDRLVGGLSKEIFQAFDLPFIEGEVITKYPPYSPPSSKQTTPVNPLQKVLPAPAQPVASGGKEEKPVVQQGRYTDDIYTWLNGAKLQYYDKLGDLLVAYIETAIDWDTYNINKAQVDDRVKRSKMVIQDQAGRISNINDCLRFERSSKLGLVLEALDYLNDSTKQIDPAKLGGYLAFLSSWLDEQEKLIIDFVQRPTEQSTEKRTLASLLVIDCLLLACLQGNLEQKSYSAQEMLILILKDCVKTDIKQWSAAITTEEDTKTHSKTWISLMKGVNKNNNNYVHICRQSLLQTLNLPQGGSTGVRFIDAAIALDILQQFEKKKWQLTPLETLGSGASSQWMAAYEIYNSFQKTLEAALFDDQQIIKEKLQDLQSLTGNSEPKEVFDAIQTWITQMKKSQLPYKLDTKAAPTYGKLSNVKSAFEIIAKEQRLKFLALRLSEISPKMKDAQEISRYLHNFSDEVNEQLIQLQQKLAVLQADTVHLASTAIVRQDYDKLTSILTNTIESSKEVIR